MTAPSRQCVVPWCVLSALLLLFGHLGMAQEPLDLLLIGPLRNHGRLKSVGFNTQTNGYRVLPLRVQKSGHIGRPSHDAQRPCLAREH
jgi:hypothetical protein